MRQRALAFMLAMLVAVTGTACAGTDKTQEEEKTAEADTEEVPEERSLYAQAADGYLVRRCRKFKSRTGGRRLDRQGERSRGRGGAGGSDSRTGGPGGFSADIGAGGARGGF